jgi:hypothetical protein
MSFLFDTSPQEPQKKKGRKAAAKEVFVEPAAVPGLPLPPSSAEAPAPLGRLDDGVSCLDQSCQAQCHDILDEDRGQWRLECCFCGTIQWAPVIKGHLPPPAEGADFLLRGGRFDGQTLGEVARSSRGQEYLAWAAAEHPRPMVKKACQTYLASIQTVG